MHVCKAGRVRNDSVGDKRKISHWIRQETRMPEAVQHVGYHGALTADLSAIMVWSEGIKLGFLTMYAISAAGSPPAG